MKVLKALATSPVIAALLFLVGCIVLAQGPSLAQLYNWSQTPGTNATVDPSINWSTGMSPSAVSPSARTMMAKIAQARDDWSGANVTSGTSTAYTLTSNQGFTSTANLANTKICFTPHTTNAATDTLAVDSVSAQPLRSAPGAELGAGVLVQGTPYCATYNNTDHAFYLMDFYVNPFNVPLGTVLDYTGSSAPNSNFVLAFGQAISRTTYAAYFSLVSTTFGNGDGTTTFNVPDLRGRVIAGVDNMGGSAANRITNAGSGITGTTLGAAGGAQNQTLNQGNLPSGITLTANITNLGNICSSGGGTGTCGTGATAFMTSGNSQLSGVSLVGIQSITATASLGGSGNALTTVQPAMMLNKVIRIF